MPTRESENTTGDIEAKLPHTFFIMRGHIQAAFGLSRKEVDALVDSGKFVAKYPFGPHKRARFLRSQVLAVARTWEQGGP